MSLILYPRYRYAKIDANQKVYFKSDNTIHHNTVWKLVRSKRWNLFLARRIIQTGLADAAQSPLNLPPIKFALWNVARLSM